MAAVFTNGLVRIVRSTDASLITEFRLNVTPDCKVVEAKIATYSYAAEAGSVWPEKQISVCVAYKIEQPLNSSLYRA